MKKTSSISVSDLEGGKKNNSETGFYFEMSSFPKGFENWNFISENADFLFHNLWQFFSQLK